MKHPHHYKISIALAISAGAWGIYWLPQRILEDGGLTGGWGTISQMIIGTLILLPIALWRISKRKGTGLELPTITIPAGFNKDGMPMGMQIIGKNKDDLKLFSFASKYEDIFNFSKIKPKLD